MSSSARRSYDVPAYFDHHGPDGPTRAVNGRVKNATQKTLGFWNVTYYRICSLLHCVNLIRQSNAL